MDKVMELGITGFGAAAAAGLAMGRRRNQSKYVQPQQGVGSYNQVSRQRRRTGRVKRRGPANVFRNLIGSGNEFITRWQNTSQTFIGPGNVPIDWGTGASTSVAHDLPIHLMSLTGLGSAQMISIPDNFERGIWKNGMCKIQFDPTQFGGQGGYTWNALPCQYNDMTTNPSGGWALERYDGPLTDITGDRVGPFKSVFHKYTDIKLNLYGCYDVPIRYHVKLLLMPKDYNIFAYSSGTYQSSETRIGQMYSDIKRPLLYSTVNTNPNKDWMRDVKVIKSCNVTVQPCSFSDQRAQHQEAADGYLVGNTPHIHELRWFVRHDRFRNYSWDHPPYLNGTENGGWDVNVNDEQWNDVDWHKRLFLQVEASAAYFDIVGNNPRFTGTYDLCVRNNYVIWPA